MTIRRTFAKSFPLIILIIALICALSSQASEHPKGIPAADALKMLEEGNGRYLSGKLAHPRQDSTRRKELVSGQHPHTIVLSCSDSRVPPEVIFDQGMGDLFVIRVAGNILGAGTVSSIEYAVEHLGVRLILILGHDSCGAITATLHSKPQKSNGSPDLDTLVWSIDENLKNYDRAKASSDKNLHAAAAANVSAVAEGLLKRSKVVRKAVEEGLVKISRGVYSLESGQVELQAP